MSLQQYREIRARRLGGFKFRRQVPIGSFIVDFVCEDKKFIIEVDGGDHELKVERDAERTAILEDMGYVVWRVWNIEVNRHLSDVLSALLHDFEAI